MSNLNPVPRIGAQAEEVLTTNNAVPSTETGAHVVELLEEAGFPDAEHRARRSPHELSGGMHQRVLAVIGMATRPKLLIADEPALTLDVTAQRRILDHLGTLTHDPDTAALFITHDLDLAVECAGQLVVMHRGCIVEPGPALDILQYPRHPYTKRLVSAAPSLASVRIESAHAKGINVTDEELIGAGKGSISTEEIVCVENLTREFDIRGSRGEAKKLLTVDNMPFTLRHGTTLAVVDESGPGKSTAADMVLQFLSPTSGIVFFDGRDTSQMNDKELFALRRRLRVIFRDPYGFLDLMSSIFRVIEEPLRAHGYGTLAHAEQEYMRAIKTGHDPEEWIITLVGTKKAGHELSSAEKSEFSPERLRVKHASELLDMVTLPRSVMRRYPSELPGDRRQRVTVARTLALNPEVIVLDGATSAPDVLVQNQTLYLLNDLQAQLDLSYLFITHGLVVVRQIADDVVTMEKDRLTEKNTMDALFVDPVQNYTRELIETAPGRKIQFNL